MNTWVRNLVREHWPDDSDDERQKRLERLRDGRCPDCGGTEWFPGAACWDCGWEASGSGGLTAEDGKPLPPDGSIRWYRSANGDLIVDVDAKDRAVLAKVFYRVFGMIEQ